MMRHNPIETLVIKCALNTHQSLVLHPIGKKEKKILQKRLRKKNCKMQTKSQRKKNKNNKNKMKKFKKMQSQRKNR
jgi:hypothetical protein